jgi:hypothetical protein
VGFVVCVCGRGLPQMYAHRYGVRERKREGERGRERGAGACEYGLVH